MGYNRHNRVIRPKRVLTRGCSIAILTAQIFTKSYFPRAKFHHFIAAADLLKS